MTRKSYVSFYLAYTISTFARVSRINYDARVKLRLGNIHVSIRRKSHLQHGGVGFDPRRAGQQPAGGDVNGKRLHIRGRDESGDGVLVQIPDADLMDAPGRPFEGDDGEMAVEIDGVDVAVPVEDDRGDDDGGRRARGVELPHRHRAGGPKADDQFILFHLHSRDDGNVVVMVQIAVERVDGKVGKMR